MIIFADIKTLVTIPVILEGARKRVQIITSLKGQSGLRGGKMKNAFKFLLLVTWASFALQSGSLLTGGVRSYAAAKGSKATGANYSGSLQAHQGRYFRWSAHADWHASETNAGVPLTSPDNRYSAALASI